jgi:hypothetical protein
MILNALIDKNSTLLGALNFKVVKIGQQTYSFYCPTFHYSPTQAYRNAFSEKYFPAVIHQNDIVQSKA